MCGPLRNSFAHGICFDFTSSWNPGASGTGCESSCSHFSRTRIILNNQKPHGSCPIQSPLCLSQGRKDIHGTRAQEPWGGWGLPRMAPQPCSPRTACMLAHASTSDSAKSEPTRNFQNGSVDRILWTCRPYIYYQNITNKDEKSWEHLRNILFFICQLSGNLTSCKLWTPPYTKQIEHISFLFWEFWTKNNWCLRALRSQVQHTFWKYFRTFIFWKSKIISQRLREISRRSWPPIGKSVFISFRVRVVCASEWERRSCVGVQESNVSQPWCPEQWDVFWHRLWQPLGFFSFCPRGHPRTHGPGANQNKPHKVPNDVGNPNSTDNLNSWFQQLQY